MKKFLVISNKNAITYSDEEGLEKAEKPFMERRVEGAGERAAQGALEEPRFAEGRRELAERKGMQKEAANPAHAEIPDFAKGEFQQRPRGDDMEAGAHFVEIAQGLDGARACLDFVEKEERLAIHDGGAVSHFQFFADGGNVEIPREKRPRRRIPLEIDRKGMTERFGQVADCRRLARLARAANHQRLPVFRRFPFQKCLVDCAGEIHATSIASCDGWDHTLDLLKSQGKICSVILKSQGKINAFLLKSRGKLDASMLKSQGEID